MSAATILSDFPRINCEHSSARKRFCHGAHWRSEVDVSGTLSWISPGGKEATQSKAATSLQRSPSFDRNLQALKARYPTVADGLLTTLLEGAGNDGERVSSLICELADPGPAAAKRLRVRKRRLDAFVAEGERSSPAESSKASGVSECSQIVSPSPPLVSDEDRFSNHSVKRLQTNQVTSRSASASPSTVHCEASGVCESSAQNTVTTVSPLPYSRFDTTVETNARKTCNNAAPGAPKLFPACLSEPRQQHTEGGLDDKEISVSAAALVHTYASEVLRQLSREHTASQGAYSVITAALKQFGDEVFHLKAQRQDRPHVGQPTSSDSGDRMKKLTEDARVATSDDSETLSEPKVVQLKRFLQILSKAVVSQNQRLTELKEENACLKEKADMLRSELQSAKTEAQRFRETAEFLQHYLSTSGGFGNHPFGGLPPGPPGVL